jgi:hypothetical protein
VWLSHTDGPGCSQRAGPGTWASLCRARRQGRDPLDPGGWDEPRDTTAWGSRGIRGNLAFIDGFLGAASLGLCRTYASLWNRIFTTKKQKGSWALWFTPIILATLTCCISISITPQEAILPWALGRTKDPMCDSAQDPQRQHVCCYLDFRATGPRKGVLSCLWL